MEPCMYAPLCTGRRYSHAITACPHLHMLCEVCRHRGHDPDQCVDRGQDELRTLFRESAPKGRYTRRGVHAKTPVPDWDFEGPQRSLDDLTEVKLLEKTVLVDWTPEALAEYRALDLNAQYWQLEREILK